MVDLGGNFNGYMGDMSRVFSIGKLSEEAYTAHQVCLDIQEKIASIARPGIPAKCCITLQSKWLPKQVLPISLWERDNKPSSLVTASDLKSTKRLYLLRASSRSLEPGMVFALEPKIVLPGVGPVGIENSWVVTNEGVEKLTNCNEEIIELS